MEHLDDLTTQTLLAEFQNRLFGSVAIRLLRSHWPYDDGLDAAMADCRARVRLLNELLEPTDSAAMEQIGVATNHGAQDIEQARAVNEVSASLVLSLGGLQSGLRSRNVISDGDDTVLSEVGDEAFQQVIENSIKSEG